MFQKVETQLFGKLPKSHKDVIQNLYLFRFSCYCLFFYTLETILNELGIFIIEKNIFRIGCAICWGIEIFYVLILRKMRFDDSRTKYICITGMVISITVSNIVLTYHMLLIILMPIIVAGMYESRRFQYYTYILVMLSIIISTYGGYYLGVCDANMVLLPTTSLQHLNNNGIFSLNQINQSPVRTLALFFVFPRCLMESAFIYVSRVANMVLCNSHHRAVQDTMTGLYNKNKLIELLDDKTYHGQIIGVAYWDVNKLKYVNDTYGHAAGDQLITQVAQLINDVTGNDGIALRYGGDEFIAIFPNATTESMEKLLCRWNTLIESIPATQHPISAAVGYSLGEGDTLEQIIKDADKKMYQQKQNKRL